MFPSLVSEKTAFVISRSAAPIREQVEECLRQAILTRHFPPGERLIERELCALLGVSRSSVREALRQLEGNGLVVNIPHKGMVVATITSKEAEEIYQVRAVLEGLVGRLCAECATPELCATLQKAMCEVDAAYQLEEPHTLVHAIDRFYAVLVSSCGNRTVATVLQSLHNRIASLCLVTLTQPGRAAQSVAEMRQIVTAIERGNPEEAERVCMEHVQRAAVVAAQMFRQQETQPSLTQCSDGLPEERKCYQRRGN